MSFWQFRFVPEDDARTFREVCRIQIRSENGLSLTPGNISDVEFLSGLKFQDISLKVDACVKLLEKLQAEGVLQLPEKRDLSKPNKRSIPITARSAPVADIDCKLKQLNFVKLQVVSEPQDIKLWQEYVSRYHYLGYKKPFGYYLHYFIGSDRGLLGCMLFSGAAKSSGVRDGWIGWKPAQRLRNLAWVKNNSRFLIFPCIKVANLASHVLGQIHKQIRAHFKQRWGFCPVLFETFVDPLHYRGSCYKAANWRYLGMTSPSTGGQRTSSYLSQYTITRIKREGCPNQ
ncbi:MAG: DUF4338 domain-containing protein [bacterium]|nr:DUF4338 domain-containing protein [bacterium]